MASDKWHKVVTFGSEGTQPGCFCRPWGVAIMRSPESSLFDDYWSLNDHLNNEVVTSSLSTTMASSKLGFFDDDWTNGLGNGIDGLYTNLRQTLNNNGNPFEPKTYLIAVADRSNNRIQLFKFDSVTQNVSFVLMFGDGPGARQGQFDRPAGLVFNPKQEQIIVADKDNHRVQVFSLNGEFTFKFGERGSKCGQFCYPWDIDVCNSTQNIVVSDTRNRRIQIFTNVGRYVTHFNQPLDSPRGVNFLTSNELVVSDFNKHRLLLIFGNSNNNNHNNKVVSSSLISNDTNYQQFINLKTSSIRPTSRPPSVAQAYESKHIGFGEGSSWGEFLRPQGVAYDGKTIFCADSRNNRVACWDKERQSFEYIGKDIIDLDRPAGLASIDDYIVIVDFGNNRVNICQSSPYFGHSSFASYKWHKVVTFGSEGTQPGCFCRPWGVAIMRSPDSALFDDYWSLNDHLNNEVTSSFKDWNGLSNGIDGLYENYRQTLNNNNNSFKPRSYLIAVADRSNNRIQLFKFDPVAETVSFVLMFGDGPGARQGQFDRPAGLVFNPKQEQIIVADKDNHRVQVFSLNGEFIFKFGERGSKCGQFCYPWDIDVCNSTQNIVVSDTRNRRIQIFTNVGRYVTHFNQPLDSPRGVCFLTSNELIVSDFNKHRLLLIFGNSNEKVVSSSLMSNDINDQQFINLKSSSIIRSSSRPPSIAQAYESKHIGFGEGSSWGEFLRPQGVAYDGKTIFCADSRNNRVACWEKERQNFSYIGTDTVELDRPAGLASIDDYIVIVDFGNNRVHICQR